MGTCLVVRSVGNSEPSKDDLDTARRPSSLYIPNFLSRTNHQTSHHTTPQGVPRTTTRPRPSTNHARINNRGPQTQDTGKRTTRHQYSPTLHSLEDNATPSLTKVGGMSRQASKLFWSLTLFVHLSSCEEGLLLRATLRAPICSTQFA